MVERPSVSIIVPARNAAATLEQTLASALAQTYGDLEVLVVDDGSSDETASIVQAHAARDARVRLTPGPEAGVSQARNLAISLARGDWLLFLDADDWIDVNFLRRMTEALRAHPGAIAAYCGYQRVMPDGRSPPPAEIRHDLERNPFEVLARECAVAIHCVLVDRNTVVRLGGFDPLLKTCEDWDLWQRVARSGGRWVRVDAVLSYYRTRQGTLSRDASQVLTDTRTVLARAFGKSDQGAPQHALGASLEHGSQGKAFANLALWWSAYACGEGRPIPSADLSLVPAETPWLPRMLLEAVACGLRAVPEQLAGRWPEYGPALTVLIQRLGQMWGAPLAARSLQYRLERLILDYDDLQAPRPLALTLGVRVDLRDPPAKLEPPPGVDRLYLYMCHGNKVDRILHIGSLGALSDSDIVRIATDFAAIPRKRVSRRLWARHALRKARHLSAGARPSADSLRDPNERKALWLSAERWALRETSNGAARASHRAELQHLAQEAARLASSATAPSAPSQPGELPRAERELPSDRKAIWEQTFAEADPWNYGSVYEQEKYERQLAILPETDRATVLELACAEGHLTRQLAPRVQRLIATDISDRALVRAQARCSQFSNIEFKNVDLCVDPLPQAVDVILCSEVLYYLEDTKLLREVASRIAGALKPGGYLVTAHAMVLNDDPSRTGFEWGHRYGATTISRIFSETPGLALDRSLETELYRIDRFRRLLPGEIAPEPVRETAPVTPNLDVKVARGVVWGGAVMRRATAVQEERRKELPILMYHRIADDGPARLAPYRVTPEMFRAQLIWLRQHGYHSMNLDELAWFLDRGEPFYGRPIIITFDDGYQDFADAAWPLLQRHDFGAEVFIVSDLVGKSADWDAGEEPSAPLMDVATIGRLYREGVRFGSHLATHRPADALPTRELAEELLRSRAVLGAWLDDAPRSFAAPFGATDERLRLLAAECGYELGVSTESGPAKLSSLPLHLPRIEVSGGDTLELFAARLSNLL